MICSVITIILAIISFTNPWFFIPTAIVMVLAVAEFIVESITGGLLDNTVITIAAIVLGATALVLTVISVWIGATKVSSGGGGSMLVSLLSLIR